MTKKREWITAEELDAEMKANGTYDAMIARQEARRREIDKQAEEERIAQAPLVADLRSAGFHVDSVEDLLHEGAPYPRAIPILLAHFPRPYPRRVRERIGRALGIPQTRMMAWKQVLELYGKETDDWAKEGLAAAIVDIAKHDDLDDILELVRDRKNGPSRIILLHILERSKDPRAHPALLELADDPDLKIQIKDSLKQIERNKIKRAQRAAQKNPTRH